MQNKKPILNNTFWALKNPFFSSSFSPFLGRSVLHTMLYLVNEYGHWAIYIYITYIKPSEFDHMTGAYLVNVCIVRSSASKSLSKISRDVYAFEFIVLWSLLFVGIHDFGLFSFLSWLICSSQMVTWTWLLYGIVLNYPC